ncbi:PaaX family transcriptional regulator C-terminal domain-containing protein [Paracoccus hibiscisoli]|uniref:PaaX family transcriptional regulator n=1 Tax=Paracoccus hibiscisoli TaxID=2023261 RepID=A0A4V5MSN1_9RHOB|nr:PaaX family transcriptional regulator C-terminal domain-containing protein [Paracoccus hibiscisoli]TJZ80818.1 PaaX family transcriptional regulator [Paracoccus hibiscisoli]
MQTPPCPMALARALELTAPGFIITVYGDVVVPRGEVLWMGSLIEICARVGFGENQVRTAVSRLVASGRLAGDRQGRRSFYRLADAARAEFGRATALLYAAAPQPQGWLLLALDEVSDDLRRAHHLAPVGGACWLAPDRGTLPPGARVVMRVRGDQDVPGIAAFWDLEAVAARYDRMIACLGPVAVGDVAPDHALTLRLLLVHAYRAAVLRDPFLPPALLPADWSGTRARALFRDLYLRLTPPAEAEIALLQDAEGPLARQTVESMNRINMLR